MNKLKAEYNEISLHFCWSCFHVNCVWWCGYAYVCPLFVVFLRITSQILFANFVIFAKLISQSLFSFYVISLVQNSNALCIRICLNESNSYSRWKEENIIIISLLNMPKTNYILLVIQVDNFLIIPAYIKFNIYMSVEQVTTFYKLVTCNRSRIIKYWYLSRKRKN